LAPLAPLAVAALVAVGGAAVGGATARAQEGTPAAGIAPGVQDAPAAELDCEANPPAPAATFAIVGEESEARYRAQEELANVGATEAIGRTNAIIGNVLFGEDGMPLPCSGFAVDMRTLQSDSARRDNYLYENTLETGTYPLATFVLSAVEGLDEPLADGEEATFLLLGNLKVRDATRLVAWEATATRNGETLTGRATTSFDMPDFGIEPPVVGPVVSLDETVALEVEIVAEQAE
jgi:hypothetical protein